MIFAVRILDQHEGKGYAIDVRLLATRELLDNAIQGGEWDVWETSTALDDASDPKAAKYIGRYVGKPPEVKPTKGKLVEPGKVK